MKIKLLIIPLLLIAVGSVYVLYKPSEHNLLNCNTNGVLMRFNYGSPNTCPQVKIDINDLLVGNPRKDGIPAIDSPKFVSVEETEFKDDELIIGLDINGDVRAYPYSIMNWHEIVNDTVGGVPVSVTYCPLCETNSVFVRRVNGQETTFGVSGGLYHSCLVMYDRLTDSLWVQPWGKPVAGPSINTKQLERVPAVRTTLGAFKEQHPEVKVLSTDTGHRRNYSSYPYGTFYTDEEIYFPVRNQDKLTSHPKEISFVIFSDEVEDIFDMYGGESFIFTLKEIKEKGEINVVLDSKEIQIIYSEDLDAPVAFFEGKEIPIMALFGFVYPAFFDV